MMFAVNLIVVLCLTRAATGQIMNLCPEFSPPPGTRCNQVRNWSQFLSLIDDAGDELILCPFDIQKDANEDYALIEHGVTVRCLKQDEDDECVIRGSGSHIRIDSAEDTFVHGITFRESSDYAYQVVSKKAGAEDATHTVCECNFVENERLESDRGGIFKLERDAGTVNVVKSSFQDNYSSTFGAAIYSRTNQLNIIESRFVDNVARGWGGAIFCASDANILLVKTLFARNAGQNGLSVVVNPRSGSGVWVDGYDNASSGEECPGMYNLQKAECEHFVTNPALNLPDPSDRFPVFADMDPAPTPAPTTVVEGLCPTDYMDEECVDVSSFGEFMAAIYNEMLGGSYRIVFCGGFRLRRSDSQRLVIPTDMHIFCQKLCTIIGRGTHMYFMGADTQAEVHRVKFMNADESAIQVSTASNDATVTFCGCHFWGNTAEDGKGGGAINIARGSGPVNVAECDFANNEASFGGAINNEGYMLNVIGSRFVMNQAMKTGTAITSGSRSHMLIQTSLFGLNRLHSMQDRMDYPVAVQPDPVPGTKVAGLFIDAGKNLITRSGDCEGFYVLEEANCEEFEVEEPHPTITFPYVPGDLSVTDVESGILLSTGLKVREIARTGHQIELRSRYANRQLSELPFHEAPNGGGTFELPDGGWIYMSNSDRANRNGGSYAVIFDSDGEVRDYQPRLIETSRNNNSGKSPFGTWISCEVVPEGQCYQVDPLGIREPQVTLLGGAEGGYFESVTYDDSDPDAPVFYVSEDVSDGALRAVRPSPIFKAGWDMLTLEAGSTFEYLVLDSDDGTFWWTSDIEEGRTSAASDYPDSEGLLFRNGILHMTSKQKKEVFSFDIESGYYTSFHPHQEILIGDGHIDGEADQLSMISDNILYFAENGGTQPGLYGRDLNSRTTFAVFKAIGAEYSDDDVSGVAFSPDLKRLYVCFEKLGVMFEIQRQDGLPFEG